MRLGTAIIVLACIFAGLIGVVKYGPSNVRLPQKLTHVAELVVDRPAPLPVSPCLSETWPNLSPDCLKRAGDKVVTVRRVIQISDPDCR